MYRVDSDSDDDDEEPPPSPTFDVVGGYYDAVLMAGRQQAAGSSSAAQLAPETENNPGSAPSVAMSIMGVTNITHKASSSTHDPHTTTTKQKTQLQQPPHQNAKKKGTTANDIKKMKKRDKARRRTKLRDFNSSFCDLPNVVEFAEDQDGGNSSSPSSIRDYSGSEVPAKVYEHVVMVPPVAGEATPLLAEPNCLQLCLPPFCLWYSTDDQEFSVGWFSWGRILATWIKLLLVITMGTWILLNLDYFSMGEGECIAVRKTFAGSIIVLFISVLGDAARLGIHSYRVYKRNNVPSFALWLWDILQAAIDSLLFFILAILATLTPLLSGNCVEDEILTAVPCLAFGATMCLITILHALWWVVLAILTMRSRQ
ncbi:hypothetical protein Pelo_1732 [Pelomyxa schiedti]|nr:hypothetical protein Pelo_1732 [Pelomyxa schiedti]